MTRPRPARPDPLRLALVAVAYLVSSAWLFGLFFFPASWKDHHGYNKLVFLIAVSGLHILVGLVMFFVAWTP